MTISGELLKKARTARQWSQGELGAKIGLEQPDISKLEGQISIPKKKIKALDKAFGGPAWRTDTGSAPTVAETRSPYGEHPPEIAALKQHFDAQFALVLKELTDLRRSHEELEEKVRRLHSKGGVGKGGG